MRVWGRIYNTDGTYSWNAVETDANGYDDNVYLTALVQVLKLNLGESPFYADYGIPAHRTVITQVFPDYYAMRIQSQYAQFFSSLVIIPVQNAQQPEYNVRAVTHYGAILEARIPV